MSINGHSEALGFGLAASLSYLCGPDLDKTTKQYGTLAFVSGIAFVPIENFRKAMGTLVRASSTALSVVTGIYVGAGLHSISEGKDLERSTKSVAIASLTYLAGTLALRNLNRSLAS